MTTQGSNQKKIIEHIEKYIIHYVKNYGGIIYYDVDKKEDCLNTDAKKYFEEKLAEALEAQRQEYIKALKKLQTEPFDSRDNGYNEAISHAIKVIDQSVKEGGDK
jgi:nicotinamide riboside kinase